MLGLPSSSSDDPFDRDFRCVARSLVPIRVGEERIEGTMDPLNAVASRALFHNQLTRAGLLFAPPNARRLTTCTLDRRSILCSIVLGPYCLLTLSFILLLCAFHLVKMECSHR